MWEESPDSPPWSINGVNPHLPKYLGDVTMGRECAKVFFPMCGDVTDMFWLAEKGHEVVGIEISNIAVEKFFSDHGLEYELSPCSQIKGKLYTCKTAKIRIYCGDLFLFGPSLETDFDGSWDLGAFESFHAFQLDKQLLSNLKVDYVKIMKSVMKPQSCIMLELVVEEGNDASDAYTFFADDFNVIELGLVEYNEAKFDEMGIKGFKFFKLVKK